MLPIIIVDEHAITVEALQRFYQHPAESMQELIDKRSKLVNDNNVANDDDLNKPRCPYSSSL